MEFREVLIQWFLPLNKLKNIMKKIFLIICLCIISQTLWAQQGSVNSGQLEDKPPTDGYAIKADIQNRMVIPYSTVRTGDVVFSKRIWREMDLKDSKNHVFASPKAKLIDVLMDAIIASELTAYDPTPTKEDPTGDSFRKRLTSDQALGRFVDSVLVPQFDDQGYEISSTMMPGEFNSDSVTRFRIKEDWFFDKQRSVFEPRIVGIAPLMKINIGGVSLDEQPAFWIYFPEARHILVNKQVADPVNDALGISFDDLFARRLFSSIIIKESNPQDLRIKDYMQGADETLEAERIEGKLGEYDQSIWIDLPEKPEKQKKGLFGIGKKKK
jgi:gliding motility associated protien GldN